MGETFMVIKKRTNMEYLQVVIINESILYCWVRNISMGTIFDTSQHAESALKKSMFNASAGVDIVSTYSLKT